MAVRTHKHWSLWANTIFYIIGLVIVYSIAVLVCSVLVSVGYIGKSWIIPSLPLQVTSIAMVLGVPLGMLLENKVLPEPWWPIFRFYVAVVLSYNLLYIYIDNYNDIQQVIGGPAPRCAYVDIVRSEISASSLDAFAAGYSANEAEQYPSNIVRSVRLLV